MLYRALNICVVETSATRKDVKPLGLVMAEDRKNNIAGGGATHKCRA